MVSRFPAVDCGAAAVALWDAHWWITPQVALVQARFAQRLLQLSFTLLSLPVGDEGVARKMMTWWGKVARRSMKINDAKENPSPSMVI